MAFGPKYVKHVWTCDIYSEWKDWQFPWRIYIAVLFAMIYFVGSVRVGMAWLKLEHLYQVVF
jgi:hypothetical protein